MYNLLHRTFSYPTIQYIKMQIDHFFLIMYDPQIAFTFHRGAASKKTEVF